MYLINADNDQLGEMLYPLSEERGLNETKERLAIFAGLMKERVHVLPEFFEMGYYFFEPIKAYEEKMIRKKWKPERTETFQGLANDLLNMTPFSAESIESHVKSFMEKNEWGFGDVLPILRLSVCGTMKGPSIFEVMEFMGPKMIHERLNTGIKAFNKIKAAQ